MNSEASRDFAAISPEERLVTLAVLSCLKLSQLVLCIACELLVPMPRTMQKKTAKNQSQQKKKEWNSIPKYMLFAKSSLAAYLGDEKSPLYLKDHDSPETLLALPNIVAGANPRPNLVAKARNRTGPSMR